MARQLIIFCLSLTSVASKTKFDQATQQIISQQEPSVQEAIKQQVIFDDGSFDATQANWDGKTYTNWNGSSKCYPSSVEYPETEDDMRSIVRRAVRDGKRIRVTGEHVHTYGKLSMSDPGDIIVCAKKLNKVTDFDKEAMTVTAEAGIQLSALTTFIEGHRLAFKNMGQVLVQSLGGVIGTGTHGSGGGGRSDGQPDSFSDQVLAFKVMELTEDAKTYWIKQGDQDFNAFMVHIGGLGIILEVQLQLRDWYHVEWVVRDIGDASNLSQELMEKKLSEVWTVSYTTFPSTNQIVEVVRDYTDNTYESGMEKDVQQDMVNSLRNGILPFIQICPSCFIAPYAQIQKEALLTLTGSDSWRKTLSLADMWGGYNIQMMQDVEYACRFEDTVEAMNIMLDVLKPWNDKVSSVLGIRFIRGSPALLASHYGSPDELWSYFDIQFHEDNMNPEIVIALQTAVAEIGCRAHWGKNNINTYDHITKHNLWPQKNIDEFLDVKDYYDPYNTMGSAYLDEALGITYRRKQ